MKKISCNTFKDILPLYVDDIVSDDTKIMVEEHLKDCGNCRNELTIIQKDISLPANKIVQNEGAKVIKGFKRSWQKKKIIISSVTAVITALLIFIGYQVVQNVSPIYDTFFPEIRSSVSVEFDAEEWQQLYFSTGEYLVFDSVFFNKEIVNDANSNSTITVRIKDLNDVIVMENIIIRPGEKAFLSELKNNTKYIVEIQTEPGQIFINIM